MMHKTDCHKSNESKVRLPHQKQLPRTVHAIRGRWPRTRAKLMSAYGGTKLTQSAAYYCLPVWARKKVRSSYSRGAYKILRRQTGAALSLTMAARDDRNTADCMLLC